MKFRKILYSLCHSHTAASRQGRRRELKSTELIAYVSSSLPMLFHLSYVKKGLLDLVCGTRVPPHEGIQRNRTFEKASADASKSATAFLVANGILIEPLGKT